MAVSFCDQTVVVTGGSAGLGLAIAEAFLEAGATVILLARDERRLATAAARFDRFGSRVQTRVIDVTEDAAVLATFAEIRSSCGPIHVLVNAAGVSDRAAILDTSPEQFHSLWDLNFLGVVRCTRAAFALGGLAEVQGHVVNIGSLASKVAAPYLGAYPVSKFAVAAYSQQLRMEWSPRGVHILLVCPGPIRRDDAGQRYDRLTTGLPAAARQPGGGASLVALDPLALARRIVTACRRRELELIVPGKIRWLVALAQFFPGWTDQLIRRKTGQSTDS